MLDTLICACDDYCLIGCARGEGEAPNRTATWKSGEKNISYCCVSETAYKGRGANSLVAHAFVKLNSDKAASDLLKLALRIGNTSLASRSPRLPVGGGDAADHFHLLDLFRGRGAFA